MNRRTLLLASALGTADYFVPNPSFSALLPRFFVDCVVSLGFEGPGLVDGKEVQRVWHNIGTAFFYGHLQHDDADQTKKLYTTFLVTAAHVLAGFETLRKTNPAITHLYVRINPSKSPVLSQEFAVYGEGVVGTWIKSPTKCDVAVYAVNLNVVRDADLESFFFPSDVVSANVSKMKSLETTAGDGIFVLGFPMDIAGAQKNYVIVRQGIIARISELLDNASKSFLIDSFVFPGNSGGPVILRPEFLAMSGTKAPDRAYLIGMVVSSVNYSDIASSAQTGRARVVFEENSGLTNVLPVDCIDETVAYATTQSGAITKGNK